MPREEIVFGYGSSPANVPPQMKPPTPQGEIVFGVEAPSDEQIKDARKEHIKKGRIAGFIVLGLAGLFVLGGVLSANHSKKISTYPTAQAQVVKCRAVEFTDDDGDKYNDHYDVDIEYTVDGKTYTDKGNESDYRLKGVITVYYNPEKPGEAYLEAAAQNGNNVYVYVVAAMVGALGLWMVISETKNIRKLKEEQ